MFVTLARREPAALPGCLLSARARAIRFTSHVFVEEGNSASPSKLCGGLVIARRRVVVETVLLAFVEIRLKPYAVLDECIVVGRPSGVDTFVVAGIMDLERRFDLGCIVCFHLYAVV